MNTAYVQLARYGDLMNLLPFVRRRHAAGDDVHVYCCKEFADIFEGVSYATAHPLACTVWDLAAGTAAAAAGGHDRIIISQYDRNPDRKACKSVSFAHAQWELAGQLATDALDHYADPLIFDRRDRRRERELLTRLEADRLDRPLLLINLSGHSSPYPGRGELLGRLQEKYQKWKVIDLGAVKAHRIYDMLALYERARALVTIDTATYHLANAAHVRTIYLHPAEEWRASPARPHVIYRTSYDRAANEFDQIVNAIERL